MQSYVLSPTKVDFWVDLSRNRLKEIDPEGTVVLKNLDYGNYEIPFSQISKYFHLDDMTISKWTMRLTSPATQPHYFMIQSKDKLSKKRTNLVNDFDATKYFVSLSDP